MKSNNMKVLFFWLQKSISVESIRKLFQFENLILNHNACIENNLKTV